MRRIKALLQYDKRGGVVHALVEGKNEKDAVRTGDGYILAPMTKRSSRAKGNSLEIDVAKIFSRWLYDRDDVLRRTPLSGGWGSGKLGDITMDPAKAAELKLTPPSLYVECKNHAALLGYSFLKWVATGKPAQVGDWIQDTQEKAKDCKWFLILKGNGTDPWAVTKVGVATVPEHLGLRISFPGDPAFNLFVFPLDRLGDVYGDGSKSIIR